MSSRFVIEIGEQQVGLVIAQAGGYRFFSAVDACRTLEGRVFASVKEATAAARALCSSRPAARPRSLPLPGPLPRPRTAALAWPWPPSS